MDVSLGPAVNSFPCHGAHNGHAFFAYAANYLIDTDHGVIVDVEATRAIRQAEVGTAQTMIDSADDMRFYRATKLDCDVCEFKPHSCPARRAKATDERCRRS